MMHMLDKCKQENGGVPSSKHIMLKTSGSFRLLHDLDGLMDIACIWRVVS
jgi:hypothetical protein